MRPIPLAALTAAAALLAGAFLATPAWSAGRAAQLASIGVASAQPGEEPEANTQFSAAGVSAPFGGPNPGASVSTATGHCPSCARRGALLPGTPSQPLGGAPSQAAQFGRPNPGAAVSEVTGWCPTCGPMTPRLRGR
jgi:hypothetical protein